MQSKLVLFGGTFDPVHLGHIQVALAAMEKIGAEKAIFVPAKCSPLKEISPIAGDCDRRKMLLLAIADDRRFSVSDIELRTAAPSYTLDTVRYFQKNCGGDTSIYWLLGADAAVDLVRWYKVAELIDACNLCVMFRAGFQRPDFSEFVKVLGKERVARLQENIIETPLIDISSTEIRHRLAAGEHVTAMLHESVAAYIRDKGLYGSK